MDKPRPQEDTHHLVTDFVCLYIFIASVHIVRVLITAGNGFFERTM